MPAGGHCGSFGSTNNPYIAPAPRPVASSAVAVRCGVGPATVDCAGTF
jgi:hypothetical protein